MALTKCKHCDKEISTTAVICPGCGRLITPRTAKRRRTYVLLGILLGSFGVHNFYAGYMIRGVVQLAIGLTIVGAVLSGLWALYEIATVKVDASGEPFV